MSILKLLVLFLLISISGVTQSYGDKSYYLIDSLNLEELSKSDRDLLESSLENYHTSKNDVDKVLSLSQICDYLNHDSWGDYQLLQYAILKEVLESDLSEEERLTVKTTLADALNNLGYLKDYQGDITSSLNFHFESLEVSNEIEYKRGEARSLNQIGVIYENYLDDSEQALKYYKESLEISIEIGDKTNTAVSYNNLGVIYKRQGDLEKSKEAYQKSLAIKEEIGDKKGIAKTLLNLGSVFDALKEHKKANELYQQSLVISQSLDNKMGIAQCLFNIGYSQIEQNKLSEAEVYLKNSFELYKEISNAEWIERTSIALSELYEKTGNHKEALELFKLHIEMRDSLNNLEIQSTAIKQQAKYEYDKQKAIDNAEHEKQKAIDNAEHDKKLAIEQEAKEKQQILTYATTFGLILTAVFLLFAFNRLKLTKKQKVIIETAHSELEEKNTEIIDSINYAKRIQSAILPPNKLVKEYLKHCFVLYKPKDVVAGDFYWLEQSGEKTFFAAADCTGHGVPGAMVSVVCNNALNRSVREYGLNTTGEILDKTRELVLEEFAKSEEEVKDGMDIAICSLEGMNLTYSGAHNPLWIIRNGEVLETKADKQPIGKFEFSKPFTTHEIPLQEGDTIYVFSDGYPDQFGGEKGKKYKAGKLKKFLLSIQEHPMEKQRDILDEEFEKWRGSIEQVDDVCVIGVRV